MVSKHAMKKMDDILASSEALKKMPYSAPEGYFDELAARVSSKIEKQKSNSPMRFVPYYAVAAAIAMVIGITLTFRTIGSQSVSPEDGFCEADYLFYYSEIIPATEPDYIYYSFIDEETEELSDEDIINYLNFIGADVEDYINE